MIYLWYIPWQIDKWILITIAGFDLNRQNDHVMQDFKKKFKF